MNREGGLFSSMYSFGGQPLLVHFSCFVILGGNDGTHINALHNAIPLCMVIINPHTSKRMEDITFMVLLIRDSSTTCNVAAVRKESHFP